MATETAVALDSHFKLLLMSRILVAVEKWWHHVIIGIKHDCVCIVGVKLPRVLSRRGARQHPREFDTNNTHTIMFDPLNKCGLGSSVTHYNDFHNEGGYVGIHFIATVFILMQIWWTICSQTKSNKAIATKFRTWHDSRVIVTHAFGHQLDEPMGFSGGLGRRSIMLYFD